MIAQLSRSLQLGLLARDFAAVRLRSDEGRQRARTRLVERLGLMHGLPQKIGQLLAFSELDESDPAFTRLTENEATWSAAEAFAEMERQLRTGPDEGSRFSSFATIDPAGISASIGQVHQARLNDGRKVAVKIQYPDIARQVECDLRALGWLTAPVGDLRRGFDVAAYRREIGGMLEAELDYRAEARWLRLFGRWTRDETGIELPAVIQELSGERILTTTWLEGARLAEVRHWPLVERAELSRLLLRFFLQSVFQWGCLHADPHPGNYRFLRDNGEVKLGVLDFGCVKVLQPGFVAGLRGLLADGRSGELAPERTWGHFMAMGFAGAQLEPLRSLLPEVARKLCEPFTGAQPVSVTGWNLGAGLASLLGPHRTAFRLAGPPGMIFFLRAFQGVLHYLRALDAPMNWRETLAASGGELPELETPGESERPQTDHAVAGHEVAFPMLSHSLHIRVTEADEPRVALTFGAGATDNLADLVPLELKPRLRERGIDLAVIAADARARNYAPGELFTLNDGTKKVRVWLD